MLSKRENQVLALKAVGLSDKEICDELGISVETVKKTVCNIKSRVQLYKCTELVAWWWCNRFMEDFQELKKQILSVLLIISIVLSGCFIEGRRLRRRKVNNVYYIETQYLITNI